MKRIRRGRRGNKEGGLYQLPDGKWRATWVVDGQPHYRVRRTRADAVAALEAMKTGADPRLQKKLKQPVTNERQSTTVGDLVITVTGKRGSVENLLYRWLVVAIPDIAENTVRSYYNAIFNHLVPHVGGLKLDSFDSDEAVGVIETALAKLVSGEDGKRTRQNAYVVLKAALDKAVAWGELKSNPCKKFKKPEAKRKDIFPLTVTEAKRFIAIASTNSLRDEALYRLAITTGMRSGEIFGLLRAAINLEAKQVSVETQATDVWGHLRVKDPKSKTSIRTIDLTESAVDALRRYFNWIDSTTHGGNPIVFPNQDGGYLRRGSFGRWSWAKLLERAKLKHRGFHHLRHTAATLMLIAGVELQTVTEILGHKDKKTTLDLYGHVLPGRRKHASDIMSKLLG